MKVNGNSLRPGYVIEHKSRLWVVVKTAHTQPGKGGAYLQAELKDIRDGTKLNERFRASEDVERVRLETRDCQFLFTSDDVHTFMDQDTFDQFEIKDSVLGEDSIFLCDHMVVQINFYEEEVISVTLPDSIVLMVTEADPVVKGQTATSSFKPAVLENGVRIMVPPHIESGTRVVVNPHERTYVERAKNS
ncbi:MAG: elongation factor P [Alphaproteobacteria bacterium]|nr:MAG: elongation factor P [Alphaproteobacteria bacterium]